MDSDIDMRALLALHMYAPPHLVVRIGGTIGYGSWISIFQPIDYLTTGFCDDGTRHVINDFIWEMSIRTISTKVEDVSHKNL